MTRLTELELDGLDPVIDARKMTSDVSDKYEQIVIPIGNAGEAQAGDNVGLVGGEGLSLDTLMRRRQNALSHR
ncbi:hypothetical protein [Nitrosovibrio tenuis]|uniref:Uncharacterized protein n=1 Tax=Nitrosovibrio tenuis TaxID=1233 RepID=A0A1H7MFZ6_9PROT|nr:hypothetical protein [Nitrosovibrio tenuis]SEL10260.1 hypothetical protein SAMN05216387_10570 [Nitrosovibrio tenuis]